MTSYEGDREQTCGDQYGDNFGAQKKCSMNDPEEEETLTEREVMKDQLQDKVTVVTGGEQGSVKLSVESSLAKARSVVNGLPNTTEITALKHHKARIFGRDTNASTMGLDSGVQDIRQVVRDIAKDDIHL